MPITFTPKREDEFSGGFDNLPPGEYPFTVLESAIVESKSAKNAGKPIVKLKLNVHGPNFDRHVYDMFADWFSEWKLKHFMEVTGAGKEYLSGQIAPENNAWKGREGFCKLKLIPAQGNYDEKNEVVDYLPEDDQKVDDGLKAGATKPNSQPADDGRDDVPF